MKNLARDGTLSSCTVPKCFSDAAIGFHFPNGWPCLRSSRMPSQQPQVLCSSLALNTTILSQNQRAVPPLQQLGAKTFPVMDSSAARKPYNGYAADRAFRN